MQPAQQVWDRRFYLIMAIASTVLVFLAFARTFYLKPYFGTPQLSRLVELHGIVFTAWMFFFIAQTALIASDRPEVHRRLGYAGGVLASAMVVLGTTVAFALRGAIFARKAGEQTILFCFPWSTYSRFPSLLRRASCGVIDAKPTSASCC
jgi:hypothetical protein